MRFRVKLTTSFILGESSAYCNTKLPTIPVAPAGDIPLQGEDSHVHSMKPRRGKDGKGLYAMKCANCHQNTNTPGENSPPGNPNWHLPPADMKMVFEGRSAPELAKQLVDKSRNGNKNIERDIERGRVQRQRHRGLGCWRGTCEERERERERDT